jgi:hypothetical protein
MDEPQRRQEEPRDDSLVEETTEEAEASPAENQAAGQHDLSQGEVLAAEEEQIERQAAAAGLTVDTHDLEESGAEPEAGFELESGPLFKEDDVERLRSQWLEVQSSFIDSPRGSLEAADRFIEQVLDDMRSQLSKRCSSLQAQWNNGHSTEDTEALRQVIQRYRSMLDHLLELQV